MDLRFTAAIYVYAIIGCTSAPTSHGEVYPADAGADAPSEIVCAEQEPKRFCTDSWFACSYCDCAGQSCYVRNLEDGSVVVGYCMESGTCSIPCAGPLCCENIGDCDGGGS
jgi:hypothetical protein